MEQSKSDRSTSPYDFVSDSECSDWVDVSVDAPIQQPTTPADEQESPPPDPNKEPQMEVCDVPSTNSAAGAELDDAHHPPAPEQAPAYVNVEHTPEHIAPTDSRYVRFTSQDGGRVWTVEVEKLSSTSPLLASAFIYGVQYTNGGSIDPCDYIRRLRRIHPGRNDFQLQGVDSNDFQLFLDLLDGFPQFELPVEYLKALLALASDWGVESIRHWARRALEGTRLTELEKLILAQRCNDIEWIREAYLQLAIRLTPLTVEEAQALGVKAAVAIGRARERVLVQRLRALPFREPRQWKCELVSCRQALRDAWEKILNDGGHPQAHQLAVREVLLSGDIDSGNGLCSSCMSSEELGRALEEREVEILVAIEAMKPILDGLTG